MQVHIFRGTGRVFGFTKDGTAANLPGQFGPWSAFKVVKMTRNEPKQGVNTDQCIDDIEKYGFHLTATPTFRRIPGGLQVRFKASN